MALGLDDIAYLLDDNRRALTALLASVDQMRAEQRDRPVPGPVEVPAPQVTVTSPDVVIPEFDMGAVAAAVRDAIADVAGVNQSLIGAIDDRLAGVTEAIGRMPRQTTRMGGGGPAQLRNAEGVTIDPATEDTLLGILSAVGGAVEIETRLDYDVRTDSNPVYVGKAPQGDAVSTGNWDLQKLEYDSDGRLTRVQVLNDKRWDQRSTAGWS